MITPKQMRQNFPEFANPLLQASITAISITANVLTVTCANAFVVGAVLDLEMLTVATFLNGLSVQVVAATGLQFQASFTHTDYVSTPDTGAAFLYQYAGAQMQFWLDWAYSFLNAPRWGNSLDRGAQLYAAHNLVLALEQQMTAAVGGFPGTTKGPISAESADKGSLSYDTAAATFKDASFWNQTKYGIQLWRLIRIMGAGPIHVGAGCWTDGGAGAWPGVPGGWWPNW